MTQNDLERMTDEELIARKRWLKADIEYSKEFNLKDIAIYLWISEILKERGLN